jgi:hypothetical protein
VHLFVSAGKGQQEIHGKRQIHKAYCSIY